jgi:hypothetical protein
MSLSSHLVETLNDEIDAIENATSALTDLLCNDADDMFERIVSHVGAVESGAQRIQVSLQANVLK